MDYFVNFFTSDFEDGGMKSYREIDKISQCATKFFKKIFHRSYDTPSYMVYPDQK